MITEIINIGLKIIDKLFPDKTEAEKAKVQLLELSQKGEFKELELRYSAIVEEARSQDKWTSRARPSFMYVIYVYILFAIPMGFFHMFSPEKAQKVTEGISAFLNGLPSELWWLFGAGYLGYGTFRSIDKRRKNGVSFIDKQVW